MQFFDTSTASNGAFTINGSTVAGANGGTMQFFGYRPRAMAPSPTTAARLTADSQSAGGGSLEFFDTDQRAMAPSPSLAARLDPVLR